MSDVLIVLNPRRITECIEAIRALDIDRLWIRNLSEPQIQQVWPQVLSRIGHYDRAFIVSDDAVPSQPALDMVRELLDEQIAPCVTGYCNLAMDDPRVNLCPEPYPNPHVHMTLEQAQAWPSPVVPTSFAGFSLTGMPVDLWRLYPYMTVPGGSWGADEMLCRRLCDDMVPIVAHRDAWIGHVKERWSQHDAEPRKRLLVGVEPSSIDLEVRA